MAPLFWKVVDSPLLGALKHMLGSHLFGVCYLWISCFSRSWVSNYPWTHSSPRNLSLWLCLFATCRGSFMEHPDITSSLKTSRRTSTMLMLANFCGLIHSSSLYLNSVSQMQQEESFKSMRNAPPFKLAITLHSSLTNISRYFCRRKEQWKLPSVNVLLITLQGTKSIFFCI